MTISEIENLIRIHGDIKFSELIAKKKGNKIHKCPKCNGEGVTQEKYNAYPHNLPDSGWVDDWKYRDIPCTICDGFGYTDKEKKPITAIVGYQ